MNDLTATDRSTDSFFAQLPIALLFMLAVGGILWVNHQARPAKPVVLVPLAPVESRMAAAPQGCTECGEVVGIRAPAGAAGDYVFDVKMEDGTRRSILQRAPGVSIGDAVRVIGSTLSFRS